MKAQTQKFGDKLAVELPEEITSSLGWDHGDVLEVRVDGEKLEITRVQTKYERAMQIAREGMEEYKSAFEALAKS